MINKEITKEELSEILEKHEKFLKGYSSGKRANLMGENLRHADLSYADLTDANLAGANLSCTNLIGADLSYANLKYADLSYANLSGADLSYANLTNVNLIATTLTGADLTNATIWDANFTGVTSKNIISIQLNTSTKNRVINYIPEIDRVSAGCFHGTLEELKNRVQKVYSDNEKIRRRYEKTIELIEFLKEDYGND